MRTAVAGTDLPLRLPSAGPARATAAAVLGQIDDYLLPRLTQLDAPLLAVVGGSTGAGKSTLVNSLVRAPVSAAGVLRPTTRAPVLVCHPTDSAWFRSQRLLGGLRRTTQPVARTPRPGPGADPADGPGLLQLIAAPALPAGLALLDAPDIDSVVAPNRALADRLFAAADLWLFVTTAERYADAVPWRLLQTARERGAAVALVLSRVPPAATTELVSLVTELLTGYGLASLPLFVVPETRIGRQGFLPEATTEPLRSWLEGLTVDEPARTGVIRSTLDGAVAALPAALAELAAAADEQLRAAEALAEQVGLAYGLARGTVERGLRNRPSDRSGPSYPARLPAEQWTRTVRAAVGAWRDRAAELAGQPASPRHHRGPAESGLVTLVGSAAAEAAEQADQAWRADPAGSAMLADQAPGPSAELAHRLQQIAREGPLDSRLDRVGRLLDDEAARWLERLAGAPLDGSPARRLRAAAAGLESARLAAKLTVDPPPKIELDSDSEPGAPAGPDPEPGPPGRREREPEPVGTEEMRAE